jgi:hypothetical protein
LASPLGDARDRSPERERHSLPSRPTRARAPRDVAITAASLAVGLALRRFLGRWLPEDDPRRQLIAQAMLSAGTFIVIAVSVWLRRR